MVSATDVHIGSLGEFFVAVVNCKKDVPEFLDLSSARTFLDRDEIVRVYRSGGEIIRHGGQNFINVRG